MHSSPSIPTFVYCFITKYFLYCHKQDIFYGAQEIIERPKKTKTRGNHRQNKVRHISRNGRLKYHVHVHLFLIFPDESEKNVGVIGFSEIARKENSHNAGSWFATLLGIWLM